MPLTPGQTVSRYRLVEKIGAGGMGEVWRATDPNLGRDVALKVLPEEVAGNADRLARFRAEARTVAALNHPNIVTIHSVESEGDLHFLTMELVEGRPLDVRLVEGRLSLDEIFAVAVPLTDAVAAAHKRGITHRDLKPGNVMVDPESRVKVLDFGLAKVRLEPTGSDSSKAPTHAVTREGQVLGTLPYSSPEQLKGATVDARSDVFSLGIMLYEMATGTRPFGGDSPAELISSVLRDQPAPLTAARPDLPRHLSRVVGRCLEKDPDRRFQSALELRNELDGLRREIETGAVTTGIDGSVAPVTGTPAGPASDTTELGESSSTASAGPGDIDSTLSGDLEERMRRLEQTMSSSPPSGVGATSAIGRARNWLIAAVAVTVLGYGAWVLWHRDDAAGTETSGSTTTGATTPTGDLAGRASPPRTADTTTAIAVLPLTNRSGDSEQEFFADGMTDALITSLARIRSLRVTSRTSAMRFKGSQRSLPEIAGELGVAYVVEGSVFRSGDTVRITAQLIEAATDRNVWADSYDRAVEDVLSLQDEVAREVGRSILVTLSPEEERLLTRSRAIDPEVYQVYLSAMDQWRQRTPDSLTSALSLFKEIIAQAPDWAPGWAGLSNTYGVLRSYLPVTWEEIREPALAAADRAVTLDPDLAEAHAAHCNFYLNDWSWHEAEASCRRAVALNPSYATGHQWLAETLTAVGRVEEGLVAAQRAVALDPLAPTTHGVAATVLSCLDRPEDALAYARRSLELEPDFVYGHVNLLYNSLELERWDDVRVALRRLGEFGSPTGTNWDLIVDGLVDPSGAAAAVQELDRLQERSEITGFTVSTLYLQLGRRDRALDLLEEAVDLRLQGLVWTRTLPNYRPFHGDPRYEEVLRRLKLDDESVGISR